MRIPLPLPDGCDSIVNTTLTVLPPLQLSFVQTQPAIGEGGMDGQGTATASGGAGGYTYTWCDGETGAENLMLVGGSECCVTVTDTRGCTADTCFTVDFVTDIIPTFTTSPVLCNDGNTGQITFSAMNGQPPYDYEWQQIGSAAGGDGQIAAADEEVLLDGLKAGFYEITLMDAFFDTTFTVEITEPDALTVDLEAQLPASCFGFCDGSLQVMASGGVAPYAYTWSSGAADAFADGLCAGQYSLTVTDANGCTLTDDFTATQPPEFIAELRIEQEIACFAGSDGQLGATANQAISTFAWSTGSTAPAIESLPTGDYSLTVTNTEGLPGYRLYFLTRAGCAIGSQHHFAAACQLRRGSRWGASGRRRRPRAEFCLQLVQRQYSHSSQQLAHGRLQRHHYQRERLSGYRCFLFAGAHAPELPNFSGGPHLPRRRPERPS